MPKVFKNVHSEHIKACFLRAYQRYPKLHDHLILVRQRQMEKTTMNAQPILNRYFFVRGKRQYQINVSDNMHLQHRINIHELPEEVLVGWFAHELGHVYDYLYRSALGMIRFGLGYLWFANFRTGAERKADIFAIDRGFAKQIIATKQYILEKSNLPDRYKKRIELYYMSADEVALMVQEKEREELRMDRLF